MPFPPSPSPFFSSFPFADSPPRGSHASFFPSQDNSVFSGAAPPCGRLAPSPTGFLHLGNAWAFLLAWLAVRAAGGRIILRIEDIDPQRSRPEYTAAIIEDLHWLGLDWDEGPDVGGLRGPYAQGERLPLYRQVLADFQERGLVYPCFCTRGELRSLAGAPHWGDAGAAYPGTCRNLTPEERRAKEAAGRHAALRLRCPEEAVEFTDRIYGKQRYFLNEIGGDFALCRSDGVIAYQLAAAVDDRLMGITQVVRGNDILVSTPRQILLLRLLGAGVPEYAHVPLLLDADGERLAKRHQSLTLRRLRSRGLPAEKIVGLLANLAGLRPGADPVQPGDLVENFSWDLLPRENIRLRADQL